MVLRLGSLDTIRHGLHREPKLAQISERNMQHDITVVHMGGILTAIAQGNGPSTFARLDSVHFDLQQNKRARATVFVAAGSGFETSGRLN